MMPAKSIISQLQVLHGDPPVLYVPSLWEPEACQEMIALAKRTGSMKQSSCSGEDVKQLQTSALRTSTSMVLTPELVQEHDELGILDILHKDLSDSLGIGLGPESSELTMEHPQVVRYTMGQEFQAHQDAFSVDALGAFGYQRRATVLLYLNNVTQAGATVFPKLGIQVQPACGSALVFFPAFRNGRPDERTLHAAVPAVDEKWIVQVWIGSQI